MTKSQITTAVVGVVEVNVVPVGHRQPAPGAQVTRPELPQQPRPQLLMPHAIAPVGRA